MLYRYLGLDGTQYESVTLPFADNASIGDYALTAVKALYTEGIINGSTGSDGRLYFNPGGSLTRAQAAAMIGRTQEKGYAIVDLTFSDTASIPAYATYYIQTMAAQGVISGYADGTFQPGANITRGQMAKILSLWRASFRNLPGAAKRYRLQSPVISGKGLPRGPSRQMPPGTALPGRPLFRRPGLSGEAGRWKRCLLTAPAPGCKVIIFHILSADRMSLCEEAPHEAETFRLH